MAANRDLDNKLVEEARKLGNHKSKRAAVTAALEEYVKMQQRAALLEAEGTIDFWPDFDQKEFRNGARRRPHSPGFSRGRPPTSRGNPG